jgi:hypothetical protein
MGNKKNSKKAMNLFIIGLLSLVAGLITYWVNYAYGWMWSSSSATSYDGFSFVLSIFSFLLFGISIGSFVLSTYYKFLKH